jgi:hypothetical protein
MQPSAASALEALTGLKVKPTSVWEQYAVHRDNFYYDTDTGLHPVPIEVCAPPAQLTDAQVGHAPTISDPDVHLTILHPDKEQYLANFDETKIPESITLTEAQWLAQSLAEGRYEANGWSEHDTLNVVGKITETISVYQADAAHKYDLFLRKTESKRPSRAQFLGYTSVAVAATAAALYGARYLYHRTAQWFRGSVLGQKPTSLQTQLDRLWDTKQIAAALPDEPLSYDELKQVVNKQFFSQRFRIIDELERAEWCKLSREQCIRVYELFVMERMESNQRNVEVGVMSREAIDEQFVALGVPREFRRYFVSVFDLEGCGFVKFLELIEILGSMAYGTLYEKLLHLFVLISRQAPDTMTAEEKGLPPKNQRVQQGPQGPQRIADPYEVQFPPPPQDMSQFGMPPPDPDFDTTPIAEYLNSVDFMPFASIGPFGMDDRKFIRFLRVATIGQLTPRQAQHVTMVYFKSLQRNFISWREFEAIVNHPASVAMFQLLPVLYVRFLKFWDIEVDEFAILSQG